MNAITVLIIVLLVLALVGAPGLSGHSYGYWPSGGLGLIVIILLILAIAGRL